MMLVKRCALAVALSFMSEGAIAQGMPADAGPGVVASVTQAPRASGQSLHITHPHTWRARSRKGRPDVGPAGPCSR
jgi:hypothetical protein